LPAVTVPDELTLTYKAPLADVVKPEPGWTVTVRLPPATLAVAECVLEARRGAGLGRARTAAAARARGTSGERCMSSSE
jgi:hypothetical protein